MEIEIGKVYSVSPKYKKSFEEVESFTHEDGRSVTVSILWRGGTVNITPMTAEEVERLTLAMSNEDEDCFEPYDFDEYEFIGSYDGCSEDICYDGCTDADEEMLQEGWENDQSSFLEEQGFQTDHCVVFMWNELEVENFEGYGI